jgi:uncharacterized protein
MRIFVAFAIVLAPLSACRSAESASTIPLTITSSGKTQKFKVEVARTEAEQARGLMFRDRLAPDAGMIFLMNPPRVASFWMKNTFIPLDMIFIRTDGTIARIAAETVPYSLAPVTSGEPVAAVLEIAGGRASELGISEDDKVDWPR